jgi:hypothetical protein
MMVEKEVRKYCIATLTTPTLYIKSLGMGEYVLVNDIEQATKTLSRKIASQVLNYYKYDTGDTQEIIVLPLNIKYELVNELENNGR